MFGGSSQEIFCAVGFLRALYRNSREQTLAREEQETLDCENASSINEGHVYP